jgi:hypothetical protein
MVGFKRLCGLVMALGLSALPALAQPIKIGQTAGFTGAVAPSVKETAEGARLYINVINTRGGIKADLSNWCRWTTNSIPSLRPRTPAS